MTLQTYWTVVPIIGLCITVPQWLWIAADPASQASTTARRGRVAARPRGRRWGRGTPGVTMIRESQWR